MITMSVKGAQQMAAKFAKAAVVAPTVGVPNGLAKCGLLVTRSAIQKAPRDTGHLAGAIAMSTPTPTGVEIISHADYSIDQEYGTGIYAENGKGRQTPWVYLGRHGYVRTVGKHPQPYMRPALDENRVQIEAILGKDVMLSVSGVMHL